jgi:hypothetical protein
VSGREHHLGEAGAAADLPGAELARAFHEDVIAPLLARHRLPHPRPRRPPMAIRGRDEYLEAMDRLPAENRLGLSGRAEAAPWDEGLHATMTAADVAVHEEAIVDLLLADLR